VLFARAVKRALYTNRVAALTVTTDERNLLRLLFAYIAANGIAAVGNRQPGVFPAIENIPNDLSFVNDLRSVIVFCVVNEIVAAYALTVCQRARGDQHEQKSNYNE
jgi:hypothetical protein